MGSNMTPLEKVQASRNLDRPKTEDFIAALFTDFMELKGDRGYADDRSIVGGVAFYHDIPVTVIGHRKGHSLEENMKCNFGMPQPEGYRKAMRLMEQADKFKRPIITFIDTPGAYPGREAEERGQGEAIAVNLKGMSALNVPVISVVIGEGCSGGALAIGVANRILMLENAVYSILSPEGFASILWKDSDRKEEACDIMKLTAQDLHSYGIVDEIIEEPHGGAHLDSQAVFAETDKILYRQLLSMRKTRASALKNDRMKKFRKIGATLTV